jgi:hypothetical protein
MIVTRLQQSLLVNCPSLTIQRGDPTAIIGSTYGFNGIPACATNAYRETSDAAAKDSPRDPATESDICEENSMKPSKPILHFLLMTSLAVGGSRLLAQQAADQSSTTPGTSAPADDTKVNQRDQNAAEPTADQQKNNLSDRDLTQQIRKAITDDKSLSTYAHNVKIITQNGQVTLKGPVRSDDEKRAVEAKATEIAGENKVTSELAVKTKK